MGSLGDRPAYGGLSYFDLLVLAFAVGGADGADAVAQAQQAVAAMDRRAHGQEIKARPTPRPSPDGIRLATTEEDGGATEDCEP